MLKQSFIPTARLGRCWGLRTLKSKQSWTVFCKSISHFSSSNHDGLFRVWNFPSSDGDDEKRRGNLYSMEEQSSLWVPKVTEYNKEKMSFVDAFRDAVSHFLPAQYPSSVAPGYMRFASFCFTASVAGSAAMVLSTQTLLLAVGVVGSNAQQASIMAGAFNWVMKDFVGQLGGVIFASKMGKTRAFDADPKRWRMVAAMALDGATLLEILSPLFHSSMVLPVASIANVGKNIGFLTASASRAALHQSLAISGNLGDVTAKSGSQSIMASLMGTTVGIGLSSLLEHDTFNFAMGFCALTVVHQGCNYLSLKAVPLSHFNRQRLDLVLGRYIEKGDVPSPAVLTKEEVFFPLAADKKKDWLSIGRPLKEACPEPSKLLPLLRAAPGESYLINLVKGRVHLVFFKEATGEDKIRGMYHAFLAHQQSTVLDGSNACAIVEAAHEEVNEKFPIFIERLNDTGWKTGTEFTSLESRDAHRLFIEK